jgi:hypothetical protein
MSDVRKKQMTAPPLTGGIQNSKFKIQDSPAGDLYESLGLHRPV